MDDNKGMALSELDPRWSFACCSKAIRTHSINSARRTESYLHIPRMLASQKQITSLEGSLLLHITAELDVNMSPVYTF